MMLRGNLKQVRIEKNPARLRALESAAGDGEPAAAMALALAGEPAPPAPAEERPDEEAGFTIDIKSFLKPGEKTYTQRCRLFVGNLPTDITEEDFKRLFERYGEPSEVFINRDRGFGFIRLVSARRPGRRLRRAAPGRGGRVPPGGRGAPGLAPRTASHSSGPGLRGPASVEPYAPLLLPAPPASAQPAMGRDAVALSRGRCNVFLSPAFGSFPRVGIVYCFAHAL